jgi:DNA-binding XRE family transcriptional regulator
LSTEGAQVASKRKRLANRRKALGFTQEALAHKLGVDATTVRRWESGGRVPQPWLQAKIARYLQVSPQQLEDLLTDGANSEPQPEVTPPTIVVKRSNMLLPVILKGRPVLLPLDADAVAVNNLEPLLRDLLEDGTSSGAVTASDWDAMSRLNRRSLLKHGLAAAALPALGLDDLHHVAVAMEDARRYLDGSVIGHFRKQLVLCKRDDGELGLARTLPTVLGILGAVEEHAREVKPDVRCELLTVAAECAEFAGWLYRDARDVPIALYWHDRAIEWAQEAGDCAMQGYVLLKKAQLAYDEREPLRMLTLSQAVQTGPWSLPPRVLAEAAQQ